MPNTALNLLHIEDSSQDAFIIKKHLEEKHGNLHTYNITLVPDLKSAISTLEKNKSYNAILLDLNLPDGKGIENIEAIKEIDAEIPIIVITGTQDDEIALDALTEGAQEYVVKSHSNGYVMQRVIQSSIFRKRAEIALSRKAYNDNLTGLPNRVYFEHAAHSMIARAKRYNRKDAIMFIDLNKFKEINDSYGHEAGNAVLKEVSARLKNCLRESDLVARYAGDEFVVYLDCGKELVTENLCQYIAEKIVSDIEKPILVQDNIVSISLSIGIAIFPDAGVTFDALLKNADKEMYKAKNNPSEKYSIIGRSNAKKIKEYKNKIATDIENKDNKTILIVDDSDADRALYKKILGKNKKDFIILEARSLRQAFRLIEDYEPDCILLDYLLPDGTGLEFLSKSMKMSKIENSAVIVVTENDDRKNAVEAMKNGAKDYIIKDNIKEDDFIHTVFLAIDKSRLEKELKMYQKAIESSNQELNDFAKTVAHDLRAPMRKISMFCEILVEEAGENVTDNMLNCINRMSVSACRMQQLISDLLEYSQVMHNNEERQLTSLKHIALDVVEGLDLWLKEKNATVKIKELPNWPVFSVKIYQLFSNLITNAVKFSSSDRPAIITIGGVIVEKHNGHIAVQSKINEGSNFSISLY